MCIYISGCTVSLKWRNEIRVGSFERKSPASYSRFAMRRAQWVHLVEAVPGLLQIVQKGRTTGVCRLEESPTSGQMDVSE